MTSLLWRAGLRHHRRHPAQLAMVILGIALGVAGVLAMDVAIESARRSFALSVESIAGEATHEIVGGPGGVPTDLYRTLRVDHGQRGIAPVIEATVAIGGSSSGDTPGGSRRTFQMIGIDPYAEAGFRAWNGSGARGEGGEGEGSGGRWVGPLVTTPGGVLLGRSTAEALGLEVGDRFPLSSEGREIEAELIDVLTASTELDQRRLSRVVVTDLATAQELLGTTGLSRLDVREGPAPTGVSIDELSALLPESVVLRRSTLRRAALDDMTGAFQLNLRSLSLLAVLVGVFLVHSTMTFSVIQRKTLFGRLRAYGAHRGELMRTILGEALAIGLVATALGLALGVAMGHGLVDVVAASITDLYFALEVRSVTVPPFSLVKAVGIGVFATLIAAAFPAWDAATSSPRRALSRVAQEEAAHRRAPKQAAIGLLAILTGVALLAAPTKSIVVAYVGMLAVALGGAATVGWWVIRFGQFTGWIGRPFGLLYRMATRGIGAHLSRTGVATAALAIAISMVIGVGIMIASFRGTVVTWLESTLRADVYVTMPAMVVRKGSSLTLPDHVIDGMRAEPGVLGVQTSRRVDVASEVGTIRLIAFDRPPVGRTARRAGESERWDRLDRDPPAIRISEPFAFAHRLAVGDSLSIRTDRGPVTFAVIDVFRDYASEEGYVTVSRSTYERYYDDRLISAIGIHLADPSRADEIVEKCRVLAGDTAIDARATASVRRITLEVFDRTFTITGVIRAIAVLIAAVGIISALLGLQVERAPEFASLRAIGLLPREVFRWITIETGLLGLVAGLIAIPLGLVFAAILTVVVNQRSFGWTLEWIVPPWVLVEGVLLAVAAALLGALYPAWRLARQSIAAKLRGE